MLDTDLYRQIMGLGKSCFVKRVDWCVCSCRREWLVSSFVLFLDFIISFR